MPISNDDLAKPSLNLRYASVITPHRKVKLSTDTQALILNIFFPFEEAKSMYDISNDILTNWFLKKCFIKYASSTLITYEILGSVITY